MFKNKGGGVKGRLNNVKKTDDLVLCDVPKRLKHFETSKSLFLLLKNESLHSYFKEVIKSSKPA